MGRSVPGSSDPGYQHIAPLGLAGRMNPAPLVICTVNVGVGFICRGGAKGVDGSDPCFLSPRVVADGLEKQEQEKRAEDTLDHLQPTYVEFE